LRKPLFGDNAEVVDPTYYVQLRCGFAGYTGWKCSNLRTAWMLAESAMHGGARLG
jgi:hypothetical protein